MEKYRQEDRGLITLIFDDPLGRTIEEYNRTANPWFACLIGRLDAIDTLGSIIKDTMGENYKPFNEEVEKLKLELRVFREKYPTKDAQNDSESTVPRSEIEEFVRRMEDLKKFI